MDAREAKAYNNGVEAYSVAGRRPRGPLIVCGVAAIICFTIFFSTSSVHDVTTIAHDAAQNFPEIPHIPSLHDAPGMPHIPSMPELHNPFKANAAHKPPVDTQNSTSKTKWYSDLKWLNPFSSAGTLDESRVTLPPVQRRPVIYTYYDPAPDRNPDVLEEEKKILTLWRKAWWAQGFKPIILGKKEASQNPQFEALKNRKITEAVQKELTRWMAWGYMGSGIMTNWLLIPMAPWNDEDLTFLRKGEYGSQLVRYEAMGNSIYAASSKDAINDAIEMVMKGPLLDKQVNMQDAIPDQHAFTVQVQPSGFAFYDMQTITAKYGIIASELKENEAAGLKSLQLLMTSHLHGSFLEQFPEGITILNPPTIKTSVLAILASHSIQLAHILNKCSNSPLPGSCPPNRPTCRPCKTRAVSYSNDLSNTTDTFTIGIVPHPYTFALLQVSRQEIDVAWVRRESERDLWITKITESTNKGLSPYQRILTLRDFITSDGTKHRSIWHSAERDWNWKDLEWHFGFTFPSPDVESGSKAKVLPAPEALTLLQPKLDSDPPQFADYLRSLGTIRPTKASLVAQAGLIQHAIEVLKEEKFKGPVDMRKVVEAWNLADTEAWRFVSALTAREHLQREEWEAAEKQFVGSEGSQ